MIRGFNNSSFLEDRRRLLWETYLLWGIRKFKSVLLKFYKLTGFSVSFTFCLTFVLTLSWQRSLLCNSQSIDLLRKSIDWFLYDRDLRHERVKLYKTCKGHISVNMIWYPALACSYVCLLDDVMIDLRALNLAFYLPAYDDCSGYFINKLNLTIWP